MFRRWAEGTLQSVLASLCIALIPAAAMTYLARIQSSWSGPIFMGLCTMAVAMVILLALDAIRRLPPRRLIPTIKNIESCVRDWLNDFQCSVKKAPIESAYFRYQVTVGSGTKMLIGRVKGDLQDYIQIRADMNPSPSDLERFNALSGLEKAVLLGKVRLELSRRNIGYQNLSIPAEDAHLFKRVPIRETLTEHEFIAAIDEVEAAAHSVSFVFALEIVRAGKMTNEELKQLDKV